MNRIVMFFVAAFLSAATFTACTSSNQGETSQEVETIATSKVEILYFHSKQRCPTCLAIEKEAKTLVESDLAQWVKDGEVNFRTVDFSTEEGKKLAAKYKVTYSSLFVVSPQRTEDLTRYAFANARSNAEVFRAELKNKVLEALK